MTVQISAQAQFGLTRKMQQWSGWRDATLTFGPTPAGSHAMTVFEDHSFTADPETLVLNPNRVLLTLTPFRLRQEAVLTGALLHEAAHARHSRWGSDLAHGDGAPVTKQTLALALLMEEARIEGIMAAEVSDNEIPDASGLEWTMRAAAAHLLPMTRLSDDPNQALMDVITSWTLRAGRQWALHAHTGHVIPGWVNDFGALLESAVEDHLTATMQPLPEANARNVYRMLRNGCKADDRADIGSFMVDTARDILEILFPESDGDDESAPMPGSAGCGAGESGQAEQDDPAEVEQDEQADDPAEQDGTAEPGEGEGDDQGEGEGSEGEDSDEPAEGDDDSQKPSSSAESPAQEALSQIESDSDSQVAAQSEFDGAQAAEQATSGSNKAGHGGRSISEWRNPSPEERAFAKGAERFLRDMIAPSEVSRVSLSESPSSTVDGGALAAWRAGGQVHNPRFFKRLRRETAPNPPVKIAVLVDVSGSMEPLQKPSALLSWALASAALDLRNFAGRGVQVESCLIHWGSTARVIAGNGEMIPGIREVRCMEGTHAMHDALGLVEDQIPGFFDVSATPENRLIVQFTDWEVSHPDQIAPYVARAFEAGVNMLTVAPSGYSARWSTLPEVLEKATRSGRAMRGAHTLMKYDPMFPDHVWNVAAGTLDGTIHPSGF